MRASYIHALEMRAKWLRFSKEENAENRQQPGRGFANAFRNYGHCLEYADSYYMNKNFCDLVDHARLTVPDDLQFEEHWMLSPVGFIWLETPFRVPTPPVVKHELGKVVSQIAAVGWMKVMDGATKEIGFHFMFYLNYPKDDSFGCWSYMTIKPGEKLLERIRRFEDMAQEIPASMSDSYERGREMEVLHEIRWAYSALHLMAQRMTHISEEKASGMARHSASRKRLQIAPMLKVVSLRRMEAERPTGEHQQKDWHWQWIVQGHWRLQPYKTLGDYKWIFIEAYVKGPEDKPLKRPQHIIYKAER